MRVNSLPKAVTWKRTGRDMNLATFSIASERSPLRHTGHYEYGGSTVGGLAVAVASFVE